MIQATDLPINSLPSADALPAEAPGRGRKSAVRSFVEDLVVTAAGLATSTAVAYGSVAIERRWHVAVYTWMANFIFPVGAMLCGFVAAVGYWLGSRLFHHRPTRLLLANIVLVSLSTYFAIHHLHYTQAVVRGWPVEKLMSFPDYLVAVTEHMTYRSTTIGGGQPMPLGKWGWGMAGLQVLGFCFGGFIVYRALTLASYCENCSRYFRKLWRSATRWRDLAEMRQAYDVVASRLAAGQPQNAIDQHACLGANRRLVVRGLLALEVRECPGCKTRRLLLTASQRQGRYFKKISQKVVSTQEPVHKAAPAVAA